jgi:stearoyl-CoA desaturase (delta-9 desaturase)
MEQAATRKKICWPVFLFIGGYHLFLAIALPFYFMAHTPSGALIGWSAALVFLSGLAITSGYHRLYSHSTYKTNPIIEAILLFFGSIATQGSALRWSNDHRLHHAFVDTEKDPYSVKKGLLFAHILWMFFKTDPIDPKVVADLKRSKMLVFQDKHYVFCMIASNVFAFLFVGWMVGDYLGAFIFAWWVRLFFLHHTTWCINSLAHYWGTKFYSQEHTAVDNYLISLLTYGEGYHNYHHTFAHDYRNGIHWYHFDPAKWLIWTLHKLGLAYGLKRVNNDRIVRQLLTQHRDQILERMKTSFYQQKDAMSAKITEICDNLSEQIAQKQLLVERYRKGQKELFGEIQAVKKKIKNDWKEWRATVKLVGESVSLEF